LLLPREIDVQIDKIQLGTEGPLSEDVVIQVSLEKGGKDSKLFKKVLKKAASVDTSQPLEIMADKPGESLVKFSTAKDDFPKIKVSINKPSKGLSGFLPLQGRRHSLASSDSPIDIFGLYRNPTTFQFPSVLYTSH